MLFIDKWIMFSLAWKIADRNEVKVATIIENVIIYMTVLITGEYPNMVTVNIVNTNVEIVNRTFINTIFVIYLSVTDLSRAISLTISVPKPRSVKIMKIPVIDRARDRIPKFTTPKYLTVYIVIKKPRI